MICDDAVREYKEAVEQLWNYGINPRKAGKELRELAEHGKLRKEHVLAYLKYRKAKHDLIWCAYEYVIGRRER